MPCAPHWSALMSRNPLSSGDDLFQPDLHMDFALPGKESTGDQAGNNLWVGIGVCLKGPGQWDNGKSREVLWGLIQVQSLALGSPILNQMITDPLMNPSLAQAMCHFSIFSSFLSHSEGFSELCQPDCKKTNNSSFGFSFLLLSIDQMPACSYINPAFISED